MGQILRVRAGQARLEHLAGSSGTWLLALFAVLLASLPCNLRGQQPARQKVTVLELAPDEAANSSPEKLSQARDVMQRRLDLLWPHRRSANPLATVAVANNMLKVELGPGCETGRASAAAAHIGVVVMIASDQPLEEGTLAEKPEQSLFTDADFTVSNTKPQRDQNPLWTVPLVFRPEARQRFAEYTASHVGGQLNLLLDGTVLFSARIMDPIRDGNMVVSLKDEQQAQELILYLSSGRLPYKLRFLSENVAEETTPHSSLSEESAGQSEFYDKLRAFVHSIPYDVLGILLSLGLLISLISARRAIATKRVPAHLAVTLGIFLIYMLLRQIIPR